MVKQPGSRSQGSDRIANKRKARADRILERATGYRLKNGKPNPRYLKRMADAAAVQQLDVERALDKLEAAERWLAAELRANQGLSDWVPSKVSERLRSIRSSCTRVLKCFGIPKPIDALDGPRDEAIKRAFRFVADEDHLRAALDDVARLAVWAEGARRHLIAPTAGGPKCAAIDPIVLTAMRHVKRGNSGEQAIDLWLQELSHIYTDLTGRVASASWDRVNEQARGFTAFAIAAGAPIGLSYTPAAWKSRIARIKSS